jgi:hypothetical protein
MNALRPIVDLWRGFYLRWALREIDPMHPDVPRIVNALNDIESRRAA